MNTNLAITIPPDQIRNAGEPVFPELLRLLNHPEPEIVALIEQRRQYGLAKYGQELMTDDGRDTPTEIANELLDTLAYSTKWVMQNREHPSLYVQNCIEDVLQDAYRLLEKVVDLDSFMKYQEANP